MPDIMNSFVIFLKKSYYSILTLCMCVGRGVRVNIGFLEAKRVSEPLELESGSEPYDMGAGNPIQSLHKSSAHAYC